MVFLSLCRPGHQKEWRLIKKEVSREQSAEVSEDYTREHLAWQSFATVSHKFLLLQQFLAGWRFV